MAGWHDLPSEIKLLIIDLLVNDILKIPSADLSWCADYRKSVDTKHLPIVSWCKGEMKNKNSAKFESAQWWMESYERFIDQHTDFDHVDCMQEARCVGKFWGMEQPRHMLLSIALIAPDVRKMLDARLETLWKGSGKWTSGQRTKQVWACHCKLPQRQDKTSGRCVFLGFLLFWLRR